MSTLTKAEQLQGLIELCLNDDNVSEHVAFMAEAIRSNDLLQTTRHDSDLPEQLIAIWFKRLNALTTSNRADLRHTAIQMLAVSIPTCLPVTFCDHAVAWMNSLLKHAFKAGVPAATQSAALVALQDLLFHSRKHNELRRETASAIVGPLVKIILDVLTAVSSSVTLVSTALLTATVAVRSYPGACKSQAGKLRQACQRLFGSATRCEPRVQSLAASLFAETSRCVTSKVVAEYWSSLLQDSVQTCLHLLSLLAPDCLDDDDLTTPKLPLPALPTAQPSRQLAVGRQLTGLLQAIAALLQYDRGLLPLDLAGAVVLDVHGLLRLVEACMQLDMSTIAAVQLRTQRLLIVPMLAINVLHACTTVSGLAMLPACKQCWGVLARLWETTPSPTVKAALLTTAVALLEHVGPSVSILSSKQLSTWMAAACKHVAGQTSVTASMLSGTVDNAFTHRGKRKQSPATATNTTPIGFALDRPDEDTALTLAALRFIRALVVLAGHRVPTPTMAHLHTLLETQAAACLHSPRPSPFSNERCLSALTQTLTATTSCLHATIAGPVASTLSYLHHAASNSLAARHGLAGLDAVVRSRHPGIRNPATTALSGVELTEMVDEPNDVEMVDDNAKSSASEPVEPPVVVVKHQGSQTIPELVPVVRAAPGRMAASNQPAEVVEGEPASKQAKLVTADPTPSPAITPATLPLHSSPTMKPIEQAEPVQGQSAAAVVHLEDDDFAADLPDVVDDGPDSEDEMV